MKEPTHVCARRTLLRGIIAGAVALSLLTLPARAQTNTVRISEVFADPVGANTSQAIELFNAGTTPVSLNGTAIAAGEQVRTLSGLADVAPGGTVVIRWNQSGASGGSQFFTGSATALNPARGSVALFRTSQATRADEMAAFVQWGAASQTRATLAAQASLWVATAFVPVAPEGQSMSLLPGALGLSAIDWGALAPTVGAPNAAPTAGFNGWGLVGGPSVQSPALVATDGGGVLDLVSVASGGAIRHHRFRNGSWAALTGPAGALSQPPALVAASDGTAVGAPTLELVGVGTDNKTHHSRFQGGQWSPFVNIGPETTKLPVSLAYDTTAGTAELVIVGADNAMLHSRFANDEWSQFVSVGDQSGAAPALVFNPQESTLELLFSALSRTISQMSFTGSDWLGPSSIGTTSARTPAVVTRADGTLDAAITATDGSVLQNRYQNGAWRGWQAISGFQSALPPTLAYIPETNTTELFAVGRDGQVWHARRSRELWSAASTIGAMAQFPPAAVPGAGGLVEVVITGQDGNLWHNRALAQPATPTATVFFAKDVQRLFTARCSCHVDRGEAGLSLAEGEAYVSLVSVPSGQTGELNLVEPGDPNKSYLLHKLLGTQRSVGGNGNRMPQGGRLSDADIAKIRVWIQEGAQEN